MFLTENGKILKDKFTNLEIEFTKIVKNKNNLKCYIENTLYCKIEGIKNIKLFKVIGGEFTEELTQEEIVEEKFKTLTENLAQEKIDNMKKNALAFNLTKEIANLKIEIMNLKKGGN